LNRILCRIWQVPLYSSRLRPFPANGRYEYRAAQMT
jgi:hypothetical protein